MAVAGVATAAGGLLVLRALRNEALGGEHQRCNRGSVLEGGADHLDGVDDAHLEEVAVLVRSGVVAEVVFAFFDLVDDDRAFETGVADDLAEGLLDGAADDVDAELLLVIDL